MKEKENEEGGPQASGVRVGGGGRGKKEGKKKDSSSGNITVINNHDNCYSKRRWRMRCGAEDEEKKDQQGEVQTHTDIQTGRQTD